jgi:hypothetical protein
VGVRRYRSRAPSVASTAQASLILPTTVATAAVTPPHSAPPAVALSAYLLRIISDLSQYCWINRKCVKSQSNQALKLYSSSLSHHSKKVRSATLCGAGVRNARSNAHRVGAFSVRAPTQCGMWWQKEMKEPGGIWRRRIRNGSPLIGCVLPCSQRSIAASSACENDARNGTRNRCAPCVQVSSHRRVSVLPIQFRSLAYMTQRSIAALVGAV